MSTWLSTNRAPKLLRDIYNAAFTPGIPVTIATLVGYVFLVSSLYKLIDTLIFYFSPFGESTLDAYRRRAKKDTSKSYALITGSSGGIGFALAQQLAQRGFGIIILAYIQDEVTGAATDIRTSVPGADVHEVVLNSATASADEIKAALKPVLNLHIRIVVNNVGGTGSMGPPLLRPVAEYSAQDLDHNININARFMAQVTRLMLPILVRNAQSEQARSLLLTTGSPGRDGLPWTAPYSGGKAFNSAFSNAVKEEMIVLGHPVDVLCILPGDVRSSGNVKSVTTGAQTAAEFAKCALEVLEACLRRNMTEVIPYWLSALSFWVLDNVLGDQWKRKILRRVMQDKRDAYS